MIKRRARVIGLQETIGCQTFRVTEEARPWHRHPGADFFRAWWRSL
jgi:hypothetical protein